MPEHRKINAVYTSKLPLAHTYITVNWKNNTVYKTTNISRSPTLHITKGNMTLHEKQAK